MMDTLIKNDYIMKRDLDKEVLKSFPVIFDVEILLKNWPTGQATNLSYLYSSSPVLTKLTVVFYLAFLAHVMSLWWKRDLFA